MNGAVVARARVISGIWMRVYLKINGKTHYLWRAVDQDGNVLDMRVAEPTEQKSSQTIFSQAAQKAAICATGNHY